MKTGYIKQARKEKFVNKPGGGTRAWCANAWRIVDEDGRDMVQPWLDTRAEAFAVARELGITLEEQS